MITQEIFTQNKTSQSAPLWGILGAMDTEVELLIEAMKEPREAIYAGTKFYRGTIGCRECVVSRSGEGKVNAAMTAQAMIDHYPITALINSGIAGGLKDYMSIGDIVLSVDALQHDLDASPIGYARGQVPGLPLLAFPADQTLLAIFETCAARIFPETRLTKGRVVSGDQFIADHQTKKGLIRDFDGACAEMEGGAVAQVAYRNHIPYLIVRIISDNANGIASMDFAAFEKLATKKSMQLILTACETAL